MDSANIANTFDHFSGLQEIEVNGEQRIAKINELSLHLRSIWIGLLIALVFVGITLMGHRDADFFAFGAATTLPVVSVDVHPTAFFLAAPILIAAMYIYLHIFLLSLWDHIGDAGATYGSDKSPLSDHISPTVFASAALWYRNRFRADGSMAPNVLGTFMVAIALGLGWAFGLFVLFMIWVRGMPLHDFWMTFVSAICLWLSAIVAGLSFRSAECRMRGRSRQSLARVGPNMFLIAGAVLLVILVTSWDRTKGGFLAQLGVPVPLQIPLATANLREAVLTNRPADWQPFEIWLSSIEGDQQGTPAQTSKIKRLWQNRVSSLQAPDLSGRDLRGANLQDAFLPGANLRDADLTDTRMQGANLGGVNFHGSTFENVQLKHAALQGASLSGLRVFRSDFSFSGMQFSDLFSSRILDSQFSHSNLSYVDLGASLLLASELVKANLTDAKFDGAAAVKSDFSGATFGRADLASFFASETRFFDIDFSSSDLSYSFFLKSDLTKDKFNTETFERTCFIRSNLAESTFAVGESEQDIDFADRLELTGSSLLGADLARLEGLLTEKMINSTFGGDMTELPTGIAPPPHWSEEGLGAIGGGGSLTPPPQWYKRTRQQSETANAEDDSSNSFYIVGDEWIEWLEDVPPEQIESVLCDLEIEDEPGTENNILSARGIDYQGIEEEVHHILFSEQ